MRTVENVLSKAKDEKGLRRVAKYLTEDPCPDCHGTRLSEAARSPLVRGINLAQAAEMTLEQAVEWVAGVPESLPEEMRPMAMSICESFQSTAKRLPQRGLGYLSLDRAGSTLSTGERQRVQLARSVRNRTTGVLYVMDEPPIGLQMPRWGIPPDVLDEMQRHPDLKGKLAMHGGTAINLFMLDIPRLSVDIDKPAAADAAFEG